jgi:hydrogenase expression/formation protein HypC
MCVAVPGKILSVSGDDPVTRMAKVSFGGVVKNVSLSCVQDAGVGDYVLVHVGFALSKIDEAEAQETLAILAQLEIEAPPA